MLLSPWVGELCVHHDRNTLSGFVTGPHVVEEKNDADEGVVGL